MKHGAFFLFLVLQWRAFAQSPTFNRINDYGYLTYSFEDMVVADDTIVGMGSAYPDSFNLTQGIVLTQLDSNGDFIKSRLYFEPTGRHMAIPNDGKRIIKTSDAGYAFVAYSIPGNDAFLYKVDRNLEVEFVKTYSDSVYISNFPYRILETKSGYLLTGFNQKTNYQLFSFARSVDKLGNIIWEKRYFEGGEDNFVNDAKPVSDSTFVIVSVVNLENGEFKLYSIIRVLDINGNQIGYWKGDVDDEIGAIMEILPLENGGFMTFGHRKYVWEQFNKLVQQSFVKFSSDFEVEWIRHWYKPNTVSAQRYVSSYLYSPDGSIIGVGGGAETIQGVLRLTANIFNFSVDGDSIWNRIITRPPPLNTQNAYSDINAGGLLSSGSIIAGGEARNLTNNAYHAWVIKLTNDGCLDTLFACQPTPVKELSQPGISEGLSIAPNPAQYFTQIYLTDNERYNYQLQITGSDGRVLEQRIVPAGINPVMVNLEKYGAGVYFTTIRRLEDGRAFSKRIAVLRP